MNENLSFTGLAPGRIDVMGGVADYSGSLVLQMPISQKTQVTFLPNNSEAISITARNEHNALFFEAGMQETGIKGEIDYRQVNTNLKKISGGNWASYVVGCIAVLMKEKNIDFRGGGFSIESEVPIAKGVSSSAAVEIATMNALEAFFELKLEGTEKAVLAQRAENLIVGAPCGLMDQLVCAYGKENNLLPIICQPDILKDPVSIPEGVFFNGIDSGVKHSVRANAYATARAAAFMGYTIIVVHEGMEKKDFRKYIGKGPSELLPYKGYLANIDVDLLNNMETIIPESMTGTEFLKDYGGTIDALSDIEEAGQYPVRAAVNHAVWENHRNGRFLELLVKANENSNDLSTTLSGMGDLMLESHRSYTRIGLGHEMTDLIIDLVSAQKNKGLHGARITGGGSGGTVCVLGYKQEGLETFQKVIRDYAKISGHKPTVI